eukprot:gene8426-10345_t
MNQLRLEMTGYWDRVIQGFSTHQGHLKEIYIKIQEFNTGQYSTTIPLTSMHTHFTDIRFYLVGSNRIKNRFRLLKIDRTYEEDVVISEDPTEYNKQQLQDLLTMIGNANKEGLSRVCSACGILGFIRFLHGYYIILITKKRKVGLIGTHVIYGIDDTTYVYIPTSYPKTNSPDFADETKYKGLFLGLDLTKDFYFSYTYDITRTLQFNMSRYFHTPLPQSIQRDSQNQNRIRLFYNEQFTWNHFLLENLVGQCQTWYWVLPIIHGFYVQDKIDIFGKGLDLILIARRSRHYAGARFLKRGINENGKVANDVETEQILQEPLAGNAKQATYTSFVQIRGSIPLYWEQDNSIMTPKPPIQMQRVDPFLGSTILHFQDLFRRYGSPVIILNLVKSNEKKPRESILRTEFTQAIDILNEMLPKEHQIHYQAWDFHQAAKSKDEDHMAYLDSFAQQSILKTGIFQSSKRLYSNFLRENYSTSSTESTSAFTLQDRGVISNSSGSIQISPKLTYTSVTGENNQTVEVSGLEQVGVVRTNCIDSLDRTNAAQFCIGKCALGYQLYSLGVIDTPSIDFNTGIVQVLIDMYEACGNQIALQYGGSELANTIKTYTKHSLSSQSRDIANAIKRYISNSFTDADKQHSINLFLGYFVPSKATERIPLWNLETDHYFHNKTDRHQHVLLSNTNWWEAPIKEFQKSSIIFNAISKASMISLMKSKRYFNEDNFYKPDSISFIDKHFSYRYNDPIRFRNQSSPLSILPNEYNYQQQPKQPKQVQQPLQPQQQQQQQQQQVQYSISNNQFQNQNQFNNNNSNNNNINVNNNINNNTNNNNNLNQQQMEGPDNRYDIKKWVLSLAKKSKPKIEPVKEEPPPKNPYHQRDTSRDGFVSFQPLKEFGITLGTHKSEEDIFNNYIHQTQLMKPIQYNPEEIYNLSYYNEYLSSVYELTPVQSSSSSSYFGGQKSPQPYLEPYQHIERYMSSGSVSSIGSSGYSLGGSSNTIKSPSSLPASPISKSSTPNSPMTKSYSSTYIPHSSVTNTTPSKKSPMPLPPSSPSTSSISPILLSSNNNNNNNHSSTNHHNNRSAFSRSMPVPPPPSKLIKSQSFNINNSGSSYLSNSSSSSSNHHHQTSEVTTKPTLSQVTKDDLKIFYYQTFLQSHQHTSLYPVPIDNVQTYTNYFDKIKEMNK